MKRIFIGNSSKSSAKSIANKIQKILSEFGAEAVCWQKYFKPSDITIDRLIQAAHEFDAGVFVFDKDDRIVDEDNGSIRYIPRDNVIAEAGMFAGVLGRKAVAICTTPGVGEISDFKGMTTLEYDSRKRGGREKLKNNLKEWLENRVEEHRRSEEKNNVLMLPRSEIHDRYSIDDRIHISDGLYKQISYMRIMNFASNLIINPEIGEIGHILPKDINLSYAIEKIMRETQANIELILTYPNDYNIKDLETKIANRRSGSSEGALYSALATMYQNLSADTIYAQRSMSAPVLFRFYAMKTSMPFGIFNVEFLGEAQKFNHVKVDLYSAALNNEDSRRSFIIWQATDPNNYDFFVHNFISIKQNAQLCEAVTLEMLKEWSAQWEKLRPGGKG